MDMNKNTTCISNTCNMKQKKRTSNESVVMMMQCHWSWSQLSHHVLCCSCRRCATFDVVVAGHCAWYRACCHWAAWCLLSRMGERTFHVVCLEHGDERGSK